MDSATAPFLSGGGVAQPKPQDHHAAYYATVRGALIWLCSGVGSILVRCREGAGLNAGGNVKAAL